MLITKIIKMLLLTLGMLNYLLSICSGYSVDQKCSRVKELQQGRGRTLRKGKLQNVLQPSYTDEADFKLISTLIAFFVLHKSGCLLHDLLASICLVAIVGVVSSGACISKAFESLSFQLVINELHTIIFRELL